MNKESYIELVIYSKVKREEKKKSKRTGVPHETLRFSVLEHAQDRHSQTPVTRELKNRRTQRKKKKIALCFHILNKREGREEKNFPT